MKTNQQQSTQNNTDFNLLPTFKNNLKSSKMKVTFVLAALATFAMAAPADDSEESGAVAKGDFSALDNNQEFSLLDSKYIPITRQRS